MISQAEGVRVFCSMISMFLKPDNVWSVGRKKEAVPLATKKKKN